MPSGVARRNPELGKDTNESTAGTPKKERSEIPPKARADAYLPEEKPHPESARPPVAAKKEKPRKVYTTTKELLADLPRDAFPDGDAIEWAACQKWCETNLPDRTVAWTARVTKFEVSGDGPFLVVIGTDKPMIEKGIVLGAAVLFGKTKWGVVLSSFYMTSGSRSAVFNLGDNDLTVTYEKCTAEEAKALRGMNGSVVTFESIIQAPFEWGNAVTVNGTKRARAPIQGSPFEEKELDWLPIRCHISHPSIDGFLPLASRSIPPNDKLLEDKGEERETPKADRPAEEDSHANGISPRKSDYYVDDKITVRGKVQFLIEDGDYLFESDREKQKKMKVTPGLVIHEGGYKLLCFLPQTTGAEYERLQLRLNGRRVRVTGRVSISTGRELWLTDCEAKLIK